MNPRILCCMPTRERPFDAGLTIGSLKATSTQYTTDIILYLDDDDPSSQYHRQHCPNQHVRTLQRIGLADSLEYCQEISRQSTDAVMLVADDLEFVTHGWDAVFANSLLDHWIVWGDDGKRGESLPTHPCVHRKFIETMGWWCLPGLKHHFIDGVWKVLAEGAGCGSYHHEIKILHHQGRSGHSVMPPDYDFKADQNRFNQWLAEEIPRDIAKLKTAFEEWKYEVDEGEKNKSYESRFKVP